jgi:hypothetical protein
MLIIQIALGVALGIIIAAAAIYYRKNISEKWFLINPVIKLAFIIASFFYVAYANKWMDFINSADNWKDYAINISALIFVFIFIMPLGKACRWVIWGKASTAFFDTAFYFSIAINVILLIYSIVENFLHSIDKNLLVVIIFSLCIIARYFYNKKPA